jgi:Resolvase, N terminal domain
MKRVAIYLRVPTSKQDTDNQRRELEAVAARSNWHVVKIYEDAVISGAKGRDRRPGLDAMLKGGIQRANGFLLAQGLLRSDRRRRGQRRRGRLRWRRLMARLANRQLS